jgi:hypothetical protein
LQFMVQMLNIVMFWEKMSTNKALFVSSWRLSRFKIMNGCLSA